MKKTNIAVLGAGNMGTAVAQILALRGHRVRLWDYSRETVEAITRTHANEKFLPGVKLSKRIVAEASMEKAVEKAQLVIVACASPYVRQTARQLGHCLGIAPTPPSHPPSPPLGQGGKSSGPPTGDLPQGDRGGNESISPPYRGGVRGGALILAHVSKGLEPKTNLTMHEVIQSELPQTLRKSVVTISGPSIAKELVAGVPTAVVAASQDKAAREFVKRVFEYTEAQPLSRQRLSLATLRVATSSDWKGVSICGALKNVYAIALGMCDGMRFMTNVGRGLVPRRGRGQAPALPMNMKAFIFTVAVSEMEQIVNALGGQPSTVHGLAGIGDLVVTGLGDGRNRALGERICKEGHCKFVWDKNAQTHEGVAATKVFYDLAHRQKINTPLITTVYRVLYRGIDPCKAIQNFFATFKFS